jgi:hypothetical protein
LAWLGPAGEQLEHSRSKTPKARTAAGDGGVKLESNDVNSGRALCSPNGKNERTALKKIHPEAEYPARADLSRADHTTEELPIEAESAHKQ